MDGTHCKPRTPTKIRCRRQRISAFSIDEIPTKDGSTKARPSMRRLASPCRRSYPELNKTESHRSHIRRHSEDSYLWNYIYTHDRNRSKYLPVCETVTAWNSDATAIPRNNSASSRISLSSTQSCEELNNRSVNTLSHNIYELWRNGELCDVRICAGGKTFFAHKLVMAAGSEYCANNAKKSNEKLEIDLPNVRPEVMEEVLTFFYTSKLKVSSENVEDLIEISKYLGIHKLLQSSSQFLKRVSLKNAVRHRTIASRFGLTDVVVDIDSYVHEHFATLVTTSSFLKGDFQLVYDIISSDMLTAPNELQIFHACASWINYNIQERLKYAVPLLALVRFVNISPADIVSQVEPVPFMLNVPECKDMLYTALRHHALLRDENAISPKHVKTSSTKLQSEHSHDSDMVSEQTLDSDQTSSSSSEKQTPHLSDDSESSKPRTSSLNSRTQNSGESSKRQISFRNSRTQNENQFSSSNLRSQSSPKLALEERESKTLRHTTSAQPTPKSYACCQLEYTKGKPLIKPASRAGVQTVGTRSNMQNSKSSVQSLVDKFSASSLRDGHEASSSRLSLAKYSDFGSQDSIETSTTSTAGKITPAHSTLRSPVLSTNTVNAYIQDIPPPPLPSVIFVIGGVRYYSQVHDMDNIAEGTVREFDPVFNSWSARTELPLPLHRCGVTVLDGMLYVTGGQRSNFISSVASRDCYRYDVQNDHWDSIASMRTARTRHAALTLNGVVYVLGGEDCVEMSVKSMEYYNVEDNTWSFTRPMKDARIGLAAVCYRSRIMAAGGMVDADEKLLLDTLEVYDPLDDSWTFKSPLPIEVCGAAMAVINGDVYLVGGFVMRDNEPLSVDSVFKYRYETDSWEGFQTLHVPRHCAVVVKLDAKLYIIGGESSATTGQPLSNVECIDVETKRHVTGMASLMIPAYGISGCTFT